MNTVTRGRTTNCLYCACAISAGRLMCVTHWRLVPKPMQLRIWQTSAAFAARTARDDSRALLAASQEAKRDAVEFIRTYHEPAPALSTSPTTTTTEPTL